MSEIADNPEGITLDDRESMLYESLDRMFPDVHVNVRRLTTGDVIITHGKRQVVVERKSRADLKASLLDGRFHSQRARMVSEFGHDCVVFVVEGSTSWSDHESSAEIGLIMRDRVSVFWSRNVDDTAALIARLARSDLVPRSSPPSGENAVRTSTAKESCSATSLAAMLRCIPGVSQSRASVLSQEFGDMASLVDAFRRDTSSVVDRISAMKMPGGTKRLGKGLAIRIASCLGIEASAAASNQ